MQEINNLKNSDWSHIHITERSLSICEKTFNLNSKLIKSLEVPKDYFGEVKRTNVEDVLQSIPASDYDGSSDESEFE